MAGVAVSVGALGADGSVAFDVVVVLSAVVEVAEAVTIVEVVKCSRAPCPSERRGRAGLWCG